MILTGDSLLKLKELDDNSVDACVTDPPYGLSFMGKKWDYDVPSVELWREVFRVLKPGAHVLAFGGTRTYHRLVCAIEDAGFEIRDQVQWIYGSGFPKSLDVSKAIDKMHGAEREMRINEKWAERYPNGPGGNLSGDGRSATFSQAKRITNPLLTSDPVTQDAKRWQGFGTALKPANEPICLARKPLEKGLTVAENVLKYGTGALNIDGCRIGTEDTRNHKKGGGGTTFHGQIEKPRISGSECGRWPSNCLFDEEAAAMLDEQTKHLHGAGFKRDAEMRPTSQNIEFKGAVGTNMQRFGDSGGASRFFYVAKASKRERNKGLEGMPEKQVSHMITGSGKPSGSVTERSAEGQPNRFTASHTNFHPTVKPIKLMEYLIKLACPPNGLVLDPFLGSGTTGVAAKNLGHKFIGIELNPEYAEIAERRINHAS